MTHVIPKSHARMALAALLTTTASLLLGLFTARADTSLALYPTRIRALIHQQKAPVDCQSRSGTPEGGVHTHETRYEVFVHA